MLTNMWRDTDDSLLYGEFAKAIQEEIDAEIMTDLLVQVGWTAVTDVAYSDEVRKWCDQTCAGKFSVHSANWVFADKNDAAMFILRWK